MKRPLICTESLSAYRRPFVCVPCLALPCRCLALHLFFYLLLPVLCSVVICTDIDCNDNNSDDDDDSESWWSALSLVSPCHSFATPCIVRHPCSSSPDPRCRGASGLIIIFASTNDRLCVTSPSSSTPSPEQPFPLAGLASRRRAQVLRTICGIHSFIFTTSDTISPHHTL